MLLSPKRAAQPRPGGPALPVVPQPQAGQAGPDPRTVSAITNNPSTLHPRPTSDTPSRRRLITATLAATLLSACAGFTPVYGPGGQAEGLRGQIHAAEPDDRNSFVFVARLEDRLGRAEGAPYLLDYRIDTERVGLGITPSRNTTRYNLLGRATYTLKDRATDEIIARGKVESFTGYSATGSIVGTISATEDAAERLMTILADQLVTELIATAPDWRR